MSDAIQTFNSIAEFYKALGGNLGHATEFSIYRLEEIHNDIPVKSPLFRANYYSIVLIRDGQGRYIIDSQ
ncbi:MAG: AraC family transcriptional regulator, partial [Cyanobacteria bacterium P01_F01_bin.116]